LDGVQLTHAAHTQTETTWLQLPNTTHVYNLKVSARSFFYFRIIFTEERGQWLRVLATLWRLMLTSHGKQRGGEMFGQDGSVSQDASVGRRRAWKSYTGCRRRNTRREMTAFRMLADHVTNTSELMGIFSCRDNVPPSPS